VGNVDREPAFSLIDGPDDLWGCQLKTKGYPIQPPNQLISLLKLLAITMPTPGRLPLQIGQLMQNIPFTMMVASR
jgi:hypothetical protein